MGIFRRRQVAAAYADERFVGPLEHGPEIAAQHTIGTANGFLRHLFVYSSRRAPRCEVWREP